MTGAELEAARHHIGHLWGLERGLKAAELGRALRLGGRDAGATVRKWETGASPIPGPAQVAVAMFLAGMLPPGGVRG